jgi:uncharacterized membrane-anchored protein
MSAMSSLRAHGRLLAFALLVLLQALVVVGLVVREERLRASGREIVLKAAPVDPRDLLRGDYVILAYEAQSMSYNLRDFSGPEPTQGDEVYVVFEREGRYWVPAEYRRAAAGDRPPEPGEIFLRGTVESVSRRSLVRVAYANLDRYYLPQGTGNLPKPPDVVVIVDGDGNARIKRLEIDGKPWPAPAR